MYIRFASIALVLTLSAGCVATPADPAFVPGITGVTVSTTPFAISRGFSTSTIVGIRRASTFRGTVQLSTEGLPPGLSVSFAPASLDSLSDLSQMTITAFASLEPGEYTFRIAANAVGSATRTAPVNVSVTIPAIAVNVASATVLEQGTTQTIPVTITRSGGFEGTVGLSVLGLPPGVTGTFSPASLGKGVTSSTLTLTAPYTVEPMNTTLTVRAFALQLDPETRPLSLTVAPTTTPVVLMEAIPPLLQIMQGQSSQTTISIRRLAGYAGPVEVSAENLPPHLTLEVDPIAAGDNTTVVRVNVAGDAPLTSTTIALRATGPGLHPTTALFAVHPFSVPTFNLRLSTIGSTNVTNTVSVTAAAGSQTNVVVTAQFLRVTGFDEALSISVSGLPPGVTHNYPSSLPASSTSQTVVGVLAVSPTAQPGTYPIVLTAVASGGLTRTGVINLTIQ